MPEVVVGAILGASTLFVAVLYLRSGPRDEMARWSTIKATVTRLSADQPVTVPPGAVWCRPVSAAEIPKPRDGTLTASVKSPT